MAYFLGIDIGTTATKAVAFSQEGAVLYERALGYPMMHPQPDWAEQDPREIFEAVLSVVENTVRHFNTPPALISFSAAMHSLMAVDEQGDPLTNLMLWADNRAAEIATILHHEHRAFALYKKTGVHVYAMSPYCKLIWLRDREPEIFRRASRFIGIKEYIFSRLFGVYVVDSSLAAATGLMNRYTLSWDGEILTSLAIVPGKLSAIVPVRSVFRSPRLLDGLDATPFVIGGSDGAMANWGASSAGDGSLVVSIGTSSAVRIIARDPVTDPNMRSFCYHIEDDLFLVGGASNNGAVVMQWLKEKFFVSHEEPGEWLQQAAAGKPEREGLLFLPYILGERAPIWNASAKGVLFGLTINHGRDAVIRAALEAVIRCAYAIGSPLIGKQPIRHIEATGGFARNDHGMQMLADMFNLPVRVSGTVENAAWGAVKLGMQAMGHQPKPESRDIKEFFPDKTNFAIYRHQFERSEKLYEQLKPLF
ncbi:MAG TPA: gluconokinase [Puia sp.]|nr:gluconokinase [Puia sp.]